MGTKVVSLRSPRILRSSVLPSTLASEGFKLDSSYPDVDTISMGRERKGLSYNRPFRPTIMKGNSLTEPLPLWEVPVSGPQDVHLIEDLKVSDEQLIQVWKQKADFCGDFGGVFVLILIQFIFSNESSHMISFSDSVRKMVSKSTHWKHSRKSRIQNTHLKNDLPNEIL